ncbi:MAG: ComEC/Rec2 family competence protein, partial [Acidobacteria bacterium]|nr:ComEC/Rec2 family competence protein [Acidobacteriota bacterium]
MKLPAVCLAATFADGVALGLFSPLRNYNTPFLVRVSFLLVICLLGLAAFFLLKNFLLGAAVSSLGTWLVLGLLGAWLASQPVPSNQILALVSSQKLDLASPLRWHGLLQDEPTVLPWGIRYDFALDSVEFEGATIHTAGGIRLSYSPHAEEPPLPALHSGDRVAFLARARLPQTFRDEGAFDRRAYLQQQGIDLSASLRSAALIEKESAAPLSITNAIARSRSRLQNELTAIFPDSPQVSAVLRAMLLGDRSFVDRAESVAFQKTGVFHVLVVAGLHVGAFAVFLFWLGKKLRLSVGWTTLFILIALASYVSLIEQRPPVLRAALMAVVLLTAGYFFRRLELLNSAAIAALVLLIAKPLELRDPSFQLSFLSIGCIAGIAVPWMERHIEPYARALRGWRDVTRDAAHEPRFIQFRIDLRAFLSWLSFKSRAANATLLGSGFVFALRAVLRLWELIFLTLVLQIGMSPLMALDFHRVTLLGALGNLLAVPLTGILVPYGFLVLIIGTISTQVAIWAAVPLRFLAGFLVHAVDWFAGLAHSNYRVAGPPPWLVALFLALIILLSASIRARFRHSRLLFSLTTVSLLLVTILIATHPFAPQIAKDKFELTVLDVGQGDSLFLVSPAGRTILIDAGGPPPQFGPQSQQPSADPGEEAVSPFLWSRGINKIDVVALTHAHQDHLGGLPAIFDNFKIGALWIGREVRSPSLQKLEATARSRGIPILHESRGPGFDWDGVRGQFLWPEPNPGQPTSVVKNDDSLVLRLRFRNRTFLLPGDAETRAESSILSENNVDSLSADVLKVGHHGSKNSTTPEFLAAVHPQWAVISAGE